MEVLFCYPRSAGHFSIPNCFAVWVRFLGTLKRPSVVPKPRSTGPWLWHPSRALVNKKDFQMGSPFFVIREVRGTSRYTTALQFRFDFSGGAKAPLGRACAKVHRTLWHPARALVKKSCHTNLINQCDSLNFNYKLLYILLILFNETLH